MIVVSKIISTSRNAAGNLIAKVLGRGSIINGKGDVREAKLAAPFGIDSNPIEGKIAMFQKSETYGKYYVTGVLNTDGLAEPGETRVFSTDENGQLQAYIWLTSAGNIMEINGADDNAVLFAKLKIEFNELKTKFNNHITLFNAHTHVYAPGPLPPAPTAPPAVAGSPSTANIDNAKNEKIKTNS